MLPHKFFVFILLLIACRPNTEIELRDNFKAAIVTPLSDAIQYEIGAKNLNAFSIVLVKDEKITWNQSFGFQDLDHSQMATEETIFRVGSVSKLFTDLAIMQQVDKGRLSIDAPLTDYLPSFDIANAGNKPITLRMLTSHRSGLLREPGIGNYFDHLNDELDKTVESIASSDLVYEPGEKVKYSNAGIAIVGYVLEMILDKPYAELMSENVLAPLGMTHSAFIQSGIDQTNLAEASMWSYDDRSFQAPKFELGMAPAGSLYAPMKDLGRFMIALLKGGVGDHGRVISEERLNEMWQPQFGGSITDGYGIGFRLGDFHGMQKIGHGGAIYGFSTQLSLVPEIGIGVACASSVDLTNSITSRINQYALDLIYAFKNNTEPPHYERSEEIPEDLKNKLVGHYSLDQTKIEIIKKNDRLVLSNDRIETELRLGPDGIISDDKLNYGGIRIREKEDALLINDKEFKKIQPTRQSDYPEDWNNLIGEYGDEHSILFFYEKEGHLYALIEWFEKNKLTPISKNVFAFPESGGMYHGENFVFERDADDKVISVSIENGPVFKKRSGQVSALATFKIKPVKAMEELLRDALEANPPKEEGDFKNSDLVELNTFDPTIKYDIRYASDNNFMGSTFYSSAHAFLQRPAAEALNRVHQNLKKKGYGLLIHDAYRPWYVTKMFWDATPMDKKIFVANPENGSRHNRGAAVDLTLYRLDTGEVVEMVGGYDEMTERAYPFYYGGNTSQRYYRDLLRREMEAEGFTVYEYEWWHFDYQDWQSYRIGNQTFEEL